MASTKRFTMKKLALIGDIIASRKIIDRGNLQLKLQKLFVELNKNKRGIESPYTITIGDEFQALFGSASGMLKDALKIISIIYPNKVRLSYGIGAITTLINRKQALGMDGPAFHNAREGIFQQKNKGKARKPQSTIAMVCPIESSKSAELIIVSLSLFSHLLSKYNKTALYALVMLYDGNPVNQIAQSLGISIQAVYKAIRTHDIADTLNYMLTCEKAINGLLEEK
jgi:hypothetical protein